MAAKIQAKNLPSETCSSCSTLHLVHALKNGNIQDFFPHKQATTPLDNEAFIAWEMRFNQAKNQDFLAWGKSAWARPGVNPYGSKISIGASGRQLDPKRRSWVGVWGSQSSLSHDIGFNDNSKHTQSFSSHPKAAKMSGERRGFQNILHKGGISFQQSCYTKKRGEKKTETWAVLPSLWVGLF